jgi:Dullard-like phosphatase family protein
VKSRGGVQSEHGSVPRSQPSATPSAPRAHACPPVTRPAPRPRQQVAELFEVVVFTASLDKYANPVLDLLERGAPGSVHHRLFREACVFTHGALVKDLARVGRDVSKTIIVDNSPTSYLLHPENAIPISSWFDELDDLQLTLLLPWLERLAYQDDVVPMLRDLQMEMAQGGGFLVEKGAGNGHGMSPPNGNYHVPSPLSYSISEADVYPRVGA